MVHHCCEVLIVGGLVGSNQLFASLEFAKKHPMLLADAFELSLCSTLGQQVIYTTIKEFGTLLFSTVMTTRQLISIVISSVFFVHRLSLIQVSKSNFEFN